MEKDVKPTVQFHHIVRLRLDPVRHFPAEGDRKEFWTRSLVLSDSRDDIFVLPLFSNEAHGLLTPEERQRAMQHCNGTPCGLCAHCRAKRLEFCEHCPGDRNVGCIVCGRGMAAAAS